MGLDKFSDYGSGSSMNSSTTWGSEELVNWSSLQPRRAVEPPKHKAASFLDLVTGRCSLEEAMQEFRLNGCDAPYNPETDERKRPASDDVSCPGNLYMRQKSWPAPERSPVHRLPVQQSTLGTWTNEEFLAARYAIQSQTAPVSPRYPSEELTPEQRRVLDALPDETVYALLREMELARGDDKRKKRVANQECRFCKNNGERESYYRSHALKDARGRVTCPVLRAYTCQRCGATDDRAHTAKYCPLTTADERMKSAAMMRSVRLASCRHRTRAPCAAAPADYVVFGSAPLDPVWADLEQKLMYGL